CFEQTLLDRFRRSARNGDAAHQSPEIACACCVKARQSTSAESTVRSPALDDHRVVAMPILWWIASRLTTRATARPTVRAADPVRKEHLLQTLRAGAVKARSAAERGGGAQRRGLDGAEHSATLESVMAANSPPRTLLRAYAARTGR